MASTILLPIPPKGFDPPPRWLNQFADKYQRALLDPSFSPLVRQVVDGGTEAERLIAVMELASALRWLEKGCRTVFPDPTIFAACLETDLPDVPISSIRPPYPDFMFYLPRTPHFYLKDGVWVQAVILNFFEDDKMVVRIADGTSWHYTMPDAGFCLATFMWSEGTTSSFAFPWKSSSRSITDSITTLSSKLIVPSSNPLNLEHARLLGDLTIGLFNMLLLMQSYPEYVTVFRTKQRTNPRRSERSDHLRVSPTDSLLRTIYVDPARNPHQSPAYSINHRRAHWRRGHWRRQAHGNRWIVENPNPTIPVGENWHMTWITPIFIPPIEKPT